MATIIVCNTLIVVMSLTIGVCAAAALYILKCDEMTRETMGVRI